MKSDHVLIADYIISVVDEHLCRHPERQFIFCGDFNNFDDTLFSDYFNCVETIQNSFRADSCLDRIWVSRTICEQYEIVSEIGPPLKTSDHNCVLLTAEKASKANIRTIQNVYDFRRSHISAFLNNLSCANFSSIYQADSVNEKCEV